MGRFDYSNVLAMIGFVVAFMAYLVGEPHDTVAMLFAIAIYAKADSIRTICREK